MPKFVRDAQDAGVDAAQELTKWTYRRIDSEVRVKLDRLRMTGSAHVASAAAAMIAWLNNASMDQLPSNLRQNTVALLESFTIATMTLLWQSASEHKVRYKNLQKLGKIVPKSGKMISAQQTRMPWHDVHCSVTGPSVSDLYRNFQQRWDGLATRYERSIARLAGAAEVRAIFAPFGGVPIRDLRVQRAPSVPPAEQQAKSGSCWVQVLRSAPLTMLKDEQKAGGPKAKVPAFAQNNCLKAMLTAIHGAQKFIYIEGQFFQSAFGNDETASEHVSGPMSALLDITSNPHYEKHARRLGIYGVAPSDILRKIRWSQVDDVMRDLKGNGADFMNDLRAVLNNVAAVEVSKAIGKAQGSLLNPIGAAIGARIERAIADGEPFHVYIVLPVHPEGTLNTLNIMTQLHLTMQSLIFGDHSLVNRVRRALVAHRLRLTEKMSKAAALATSEAMSVSELVETTSDEWKEYVTLLNLRNWESIQKRPVTEQIYVHSKLLIADDRVAVLGSANINDRSQLGDRDSELAIIVRDDAQIMVKLNGRDQDPVSSTVHGLRQRLWLKLFGFAGGTSPVQSLKAMISRPAAPETWRAIQATAQRNALIYRKAFPFLPAADGTPSSIWPTWNSQRRVLEFFMPFNEQFWRSREIRDESLTWDAKQRAPESIPAGIEGYVVALPTQWTFGENNLSGMNLSMLANIPSVSPAVAANTQEDGTHTKSG
jgi:phospholipase D1/2